MFARFRPDPVFADNTVAPIEPSGELLDLRERLAHAVARLDATLAVEGARPQGERDWRLMNQFLEVRNILSPPTSGTQDVRGAVPVIPGRAS